MFRFASALAAGVGLSALSLVAQVPPAKSLPSQPRPATSKPAAVPSLGAVSFPNSGAPAAQAPFIRGVAWLHSFGYEDAIDAFQEAQKIDPSFVMAYWGEALSFDQPLWFMEEPDKGRAASSASSVRRRWNDGRRQDAAGAGLPRRGRGALQRGRHALAAPEVLTEAMATLAAAHPEDDEAQLFHALSLLAVLPRGDQSVPQRQKAGAMAEAVFREEPAAPRRRALHHPRLRPRVAGAQGAGGGARLREDRARGEPRAAHAGARVRAARLLGGGGRHRSRLVGGLDRSGRAAGLPNTCATSTASPGCTTSGRSSGASARRPAALVLVDEALKAARPTDAIGGHHYADARSDAASARRRCATTAARCARDTSSKASAGAR
jgi:hypothetical protein